MQDLTGQHFGFLEVLGPGKLHPIYGKAIWKCKYHLCGDVVEISGISLKSGSQSCGCIKSKGEQKIKQILLDNEIEFEQQKTFPTCKFPESNQYARFDFYLPKFNILIEYDGLQHFPNTRRAGWFTEEMFINIQNRDNYKNQWCKENDICLIRIPYTKYDILTLEDLLPKNLDKIL